MLQYMRQVAAQRRTAASSCTVATASLKAPDTTARGGTGATAAACIAALQHLSPCLLAP
jgi:hypothetical protein